MDKFSYALDTEKRFYPCKENNSKEEKIITRHVGCIEAESISDAFAYVLDKYSKVGVVTDIRVIPRNDSDEFGVYKYFLFPRD
jgi:hypothetical protein